MNEWKQAESSVEPAVLDLTQSPTTAYERRNIKQVEKTDTEGVTQTIWQYEERELAIREYEKQQSEMSSPVTQMIMQTLSDLDLKIEMIGV